MSVLQTTKRRLGQLRRGRSLYLFAVCVRDAIRYNPAGEQERYERRFADSHDPYGYERHAYERARYQRAAAMLDAFRGGRRFRRALEVGCHEGAFSELLLDRCESIVASDQSGVMLGRTEERFRERHHVEILQWNLCVDAVPGTFDLVVLMDVLECIHRPGALRAARNKMVDSLPAGGCLLVTNSTVNEGLEKAWWARFFLRGGRRINDFVARHPQLRMLQDFNESEHVLTIFEKEGTGTARQ